MDDEIKIPNRGIKILHGLNDYNEVRSIAIDRIDDFPDHPYPVRDDESLVELAKSISQNGQLEPALIRAIENNRYQMLSGHRRKLAQLKLGSKMIRAIVIDPITDAQAKAIMLDSNIRRDELLPSEKARIYYEKKQLYQKMDRDELAELSEMFGFTGCSATSIVAKRSDESEGQIKRYIRFHISASDKLKSMVDENAISLRIADELTSLSCDTQDCVCDLLKEHGRKLSYEQVFRIKELGATSTKAIEEILGISAPEETPNARLRLSAKKIRTYFPANYSSEQIESVIYALLEEWRRGQCSTE